MRREVIFDGVKWFVDTSSDEGATGRVAANMEYGGFRYTNETTTDLYIGREINAVRGYVAVAGRHTISVMDSTSGEILDTAEFTSTDAHISDARKSTFLLSKPLVAITGQQLVIGSADASLGSFYYSDVTGMENIYTYAASVRKDSPAGSTNNNRNLLIDLGYRP